jgi:hypothetical protein
MARDKESIPFPIDPPWILDSPPVDKYLPILNLYLFPLRRDHPFDKILLRILRIDEHDDISPLRLMERQEFLPDIGDPDAIDELADQDMIPY